MAPLRTTQRKSRYLHLRSVTLPATREFCLLRDIEGATSMTQSAFPHRTPRTMTAGRYLDKLKALPGARNWGGTRGAREFWPDSAKLVISISLQFEAGAQPATGASSPLPAIDTRYPDLAVGKWYDYGFKEGVPRLLEIFQRRRVRVTS